MKRNPTPLVVANWKMNPPSREKAQKLFTEITKAVSKAGKAEIVVAAPFVFIAELQRLLKRSKVALGAQNVFYEQAGAFTGEVSVSMLKSVGVSHVIIGHSERRALGESNETVRKNAEAVLQGGLTAIVCIGEKTRDSRGDYFNAVEAQMNSLIATIKKAHLHRLVIAYEPIWAIGTQKHATPEDVQEMKLFIQKGLSDHFGRGAVGKVRIIYGGSVTAENAQALLFDGKADGFLVGGASLKAAEFGAIVGISDAYGKA